MNQKIAVEKLNIKDDYQVSATKAIDGDEKIEEGGVMGDNP